MVPFPCQAPGMHHYPNIIEAVYGYWKDKHTRAGNPLIQRLWCAAQCSSGEAGPFLLCRAPGGSDRRMGLVMLLS